MSALAILSIIEAAIAAAPKFIEIAGELKDFVTYMFTKASISKAEQDALHAYVDAIGAMVAAGIVPKHWQVQPDPV